MDNAAKPTTLYLNMLAQAWSGITNDTSLTALDWVFCL